MIEWNMKNLPEVNVSYEKLYQMLNAPIRLKLLMTGIELKVFNQLSTPKSAETVAMALHTDLNNTRFFLDGLTAIDLVQKTKDQYRNTQIAQTFLTEGNPTYLGPLFTFMTTHDSPIVENLSKLVREGPPPKTLLRVKKEEVTTYASILASYQRAGTAQEAVRIVSELPEFPSLKTMLDLGGGPGLVGLAIVARHPTVRGVIFDLPDMVEVTKTFIKEYKLEKRVKVLSGDFNRDPVGEGYDLIWSSTALQFAKDVDTVMHKIRDALNVNGVFISIFPFGLCHERTKPEIHVLGLLPLNLMGHNMIFDRGVIADSIRRVGFKSIRSQILNTPMGPMDLDIARK
jgi:hypothetical protein